MSDPAAAGPRGSGQALREQPRYNPNLGNSSCSRFLPEKFSLLFSHDRRYNFAVSASEIIKALSKLSVAAIREGLLEIANQEPDVGLCNQAALDGALILDRMENEYT